MWQTECKSYSKHQSVHHENAAWLMNIKSSRQELQLEPYYAVLWMICEPFCVGQMWKYPPHITLSSPTCPDLSDIIHIWVMTSIKHHTVLEVHPLGKSRIFRGLPWGRRCESHGTSSLLRPVTKQKRVGVGGEEGCETSVMIRPQCNYREAPLTVIDQWGTPLMKTRAQGLPGANWQK